jgi:hypothetical protein
MNVLIDWACKENCWNLVDTYGFMRCVGCGACSKDLKTRYEARLDCFQRWLQDQYKFDDWDDEYGLGKLQEENVVSNIRCFKRRIRYYKRMLRKLNEKGEEHAEDDNAVCGEAGLGVHAGISELQG